jgi:hypothetical protein
LLPSQSARAGFVSEELVDQIVNPQVDLVVARSLEGDEATSPSEERKG